MITLVNINGISPNLASVCIDIVKIWFYEIADRQTSSVFTEFSDMSVFSFLDAKFSKYQWIFTTLGVCISLILLICFKIANG